MSIKDRIEADLKTAMLAGDKAKVMTLRGLKSAILYAEVAGGSRSAGLTDAEVTEVLAKEARKRQESADLYARGGDNARLDQELAEKAIIEKYLPAQLSDEALGQIVGQVVREVEPGGMQDMGKVIALVKERALGQADGSRIAAAVRQLLQ